MVLDASAILEILLQSDKAPHIQSRISEHGHNLSCPHLLDLEVTQVLRRYVQIGKLRAPRAHEALVNLSRFPMKRYPHTSLVPRIWELRDNLTAYDAAYVALAETLSVPLITCDNRLRSAPGHSAKVEVV